MSNDAVHIKRAAWDQLMAIRESGVTNMFDFHRVRDLAESYLYDELAEFLNESSKTEYAKMIFGNVVVDEPDGSMTERPSP